MYEEVYIHIEVYLYIKVQILDRILKNACRERAGRADRAARFNSELAELAGKITPKDHFNFIAARMTGNKLLGLVSNREELPSRSLDCWKAIMEQATVTMVTSF